ncbi:MAG: hypothetical protein RML45_06240 [Acetobacteraceae bacterium]|nr:hypothetical protein [Acetobacteraceae bacterium]
MVELHRVDADEGAGSVEVQVEHDTVAEQAAKQAGDVLDRVGEPENPGLQRLAPAEGQKLPHQRRAAFGAAPDVQQIGLRRLVERTAGEAKVGGGDDGRQQVVEVMRDAARELADRLHLLGLRKLGLDHAVARDVRHAHDRAADRAVVLGEGVDRDQRHRTADRNTVRAEPLGQPEFQPLTEAEPAAGTREFGLKLRAILGMEESCE